MNCKWCDEPIDLPAEVTAISNWINHDMHRECAIRAVAGSVAHQKRECSCYGGTDEGEDGVSKREAAIAALDHFMGDRLLMGGWDEGG